MDWSEVAKSLKCSEELLEATLNYDAEKVAWILEQCHNDNTSILQYNDENSLVCVISIAYYTDKISEYTGDILLVGINYDDEKGHTCEIEEIVKQ